MGEEGALLDTRVVAAELINVLRPTVAIARLTTFSALALHAFPADSSQLLTGDESCLDMFEQEVRR